MSACRPRSERAGSRVVRAAGLVLAAVLACAGPGHAEAPARVVSINLCTNQLVLMQAALGQLVSVSRLSQNSRSSAMARQAAALPANSSLAEDVFLYRSDLVLAGTFTGRATLSMLRHLEVVELGPAYALADVRDLLSTAGAALGRARQAEATVARFDADLAALHAEIADRLRAALSYANGYTNGDRTLACDNITAAGFSNAASELGLVRGGHLPLERLVITAPDLVVTGQPQRGAARAEAVLHHPALAATGSRHAPTTDRDWICGTPHVLSAVRDMAVARKALPAETRPQSGRKR